MKKTGLILLISGFWLLVSGFFTHIHAQEETLTLLTYYPAPYGVYQRLQVGSSYPSIWQSDISIHRHAALTHNAYWDGTSNYKYSVTHGSFGARMITFQYSGSDSPTAPGQGIHFFEVAGPSSPNTNITWGDPELSIMDNLVVFDDTVQIGMGTNNPTGVLELARNSTSTSLTISSYHNTEATSPTLIFRKADNTMTTPNPVDTDAVLGTINFQGYDDNSFESGASIYARADANWGSSERGTELNFQTRDGNGSLTDQMTIAANGDVDFRNMPGVAYDNSFSKDWATFPYDVAGWDGGTPPNNFRSIQRMDITPPADGYLLVQVSGNMYTYYDDTYRMFVGISETLNGSPPNGAYSRARMDGGGPNQCFPFHVSRVFSVTVGVSQSFHIVGSHDTYSGTNSRFIVSGSVQAIFIPVTITSSITTF